MKRLVMVGLALGVVGIVVGSTFLVWDAATNPDRPGEDEPKAFLYADPVTDSAELDGSVIEYADLTPEQQAVFEQAVADDDQQAAIPDDADHSVWLDAAAVRYQNRTYRVGVAES